MSYFETFPIARSRTRNRLGPGAPWRQILQPVSSLASAILHPPDSPDRLYASKPYLDAYAEHTDRRVERDPHSAVGGLWEELGRLQFDFLLARGLRPHHTFLDLGCGTLRGGRHFIPYLDPARYTGVDISPKAIEFAEDLVREENLTPKRPRLLVSRNKDLKFTEFDGETFDFLLAQSVFTHLKPEHIEECFAHVGRIMGPDSRFFFTFHPGDEFAPKGRKDFRYPFSFFASLAEKHGLRVEDLSSRYPHPRGQQMAMLSRRPAA